MVRAGKITLFLLLLLVYLSNFKLDYTNGDIFTFRYTAHSMLKEFNFNLDEFYEHFLEKAPWLIYNGPHGERIPYYLIRINGHYLPTDGVGPAILALPIFLIPILVFGLPPASWAMVFLSKAAASILIALSAVFIYLAAKSLAGERKAWLVVFIYALCSGMWSITSQGLYQQTGSEFFLAMSVYFLVRGLGEPGYIPYAGAALAAAALMRPTNIMVMIILSIYVFRRHRDRFRRYILYAAPVVLFILVYNYNHHGSLFLFSLMVYNPISALSKTGSSNMWSTPLLTGLSGLLISPSRGLFIYSPVFIFSFIGIAAVWRKKNEMLFKYFFLAAAALIIVHSKWHDWWGGWTFGCRMLNDSIPFLSLALLPAMAYLKKARGLIPVFILTIIFSFLVQIIGAFFYDNGWNREPDIDANQYRLWLWKESQLPYYIGRLFQNENRPRQ